VARRRYISTLISRDRDVDRLAKEAGDFAVLLYTWMIPHTEDDCTLHGDPGEVMITVIPWRRDKTEQNVIDALEAMDRIGLIVWDRDNNTIYFPPESFYRYQTYIADGKRRSAESIPQRRRTPKNAEERRETAPNTASPSPSLSPSPTPIPTPTPREEKELKKELTRTSQNDGAAQPPSEPTEGVTRAAKKQANPQVAQLIDRFHDGFVQKFGRKPVIHPGKDGAISKRLLGIHDYDLLCRLLDAYFASTDRYITNSGYTLGAFEGCVNRLIVSQAASSHQSSLPDTSDTIDRFMRENQREGGGQG
jgi:hypothetical protein